MVLKPPWYSWQSLDFYVEKFGGGVIGKKYGLCEGKLQWKGSCESSKMALPIGG